MYITDSKVGNHKIPLNDLLYKGLLRVRKNEKSPYVFCHKNGKPHKDIRRSFSLALERAEIEGFQFHDLRHTFASHLVMAGIDLKTVQELLGHKTIEMTLRYSHLSPDHKWRAVNVLGKKMVTNWSQTLGEKEESFLTESSELLVGEGLVTPGRSGEMVDAVDLKSTGQFMSVPVQVRPPAPNTYLVACGA